MKNTRKGFTLVELLVVIAILAILGTVTVISFTGCIQQAKLSADAQVAEQMNTALEAGSVMDKPENFGDVLTLLTDNGFELKNFKTTAEGFSYYWSAEKNVIVLYNAEKNEVAYPVGLAEFDPSASVSVDDVLSNVALVGGEECDTIEEAFTYANAHPGSTLHVLISSGIPDGGIEIKANMTIKGHGNALSGNGTRGLKVAVSNIKVAISDLNISVSGQGSQALQVNTPLENVDLTIDNCQITARDYTIILVGGKNINFTMTNSYSYGWTALYVKSSDSNVKVEGSVLSSMNNVAAAETNAFSTINIHQCTGTKVEISDTKIDAETVGNNEQFWLDISHGAASNTVVVTGCDIDDVANYHTFFNPDNNPNYVSYVTGEGNNLTVDGTEINLYE